MKITTNDFQHTLVTVGNRGPRDALSTKLKAGFVAN